jgi:hypothetical protein
VSQCAGIDTATRQAAHALAWTLSERLPAAGLPSRIEAAPLDLVAEVLAKMIRGDPMRLMDGEPLPSRSSRDCA